MKTIEAIAEEARSYVEWLQEEHGLWYDDMCGLCAIAAHTVWRGLKENGYDAKLVHSYGHMFTITGDILIDVTASQFGYDDINIKERGEDDNCWFWKENQIYETEEEFMEFLDPWPRKQNPYKVNKEVAA